MGKRGKFFSLFLMALCIWNMGSLFLQGKHKFLSHDYWVRYPELKHVYENSVYANKNGNFVPDEILYAYNGGALLSGTSPILVNPEIPPLGKYLIGLSIALFGNEHLMIFLFGCGALILLYVLGRQLNLSPALALITPTLLSFEPLFRSQFIYTPLLDIFQLVFLLCGFITFNQRRLFFSLFFLGCFISTKFFGSGVSIVLAYIAVLLLQKEYKNLFRFFMLLPISGGILLLSYIRVLMIGYPFLKFLGIQKWVLWYNSGHVRNLFSVWPLLMTNRWITNGALSHDPQWTLLWPTSVILTMLGGISVLRRNRSTQRGVMVLITWSIWYMLLLSISDASARYFVILLPVLYLISVWSITRLPWKYGHLHR